MDLLKLILPETIIVIRKAYARAYLPGLYKIFLLCLFDPTPGFFVSIRNQAGAIQRIIINKTECQVAPAGEAAFDESFNVLSVLMRV